MDFQQEFITTIHNFGVDVEHLEQRLMALSQTSPMALLIPSLYEELERPALSRIREHLKSCHYIKVINVCLYAETVEQYRNAVAFFSELPQTVNVIWTNGPRVRKLLKILAEQKLNLLDYKGKGWAVWLGLGLSSLDAQTIALHDADIVTFDRSLVAKLFYPIAEKEFGLAYNKAYYTRLGLADRSMNGRAVRLFVAPILSALQDVLGHNAYLRYLRAYRYPLAGEFAMTSDLALNLRVPCDWGLEVGLLAEVYRNVAPKRVSQVDLGFFDHKHKEVGEGPSDGLQKMCTEILGSILKTLTETESVVISDAHQMAMRVKFRRVAQDLIRQYFVDASCNGIPYDRHREETTVESFEQVIPVAFKKYLNEPAGSRIPDWTRALSVMPDLRERLLAAVKTDMAEAKLESPTDIEAMSCKLPTLMSA
ncbi:glucosyl-3-phosphoglycerate synthase [filamentous cyanobacterium LEGE 11480]|uniref:Glucosyl-3-phosphoglycerate synthase n=1 Tax=Romeriopsis navalis LEGE 11480 TaxID=2777977 RepID=A0A928VQ72_9CYAN|nr:glucosyl-3-phosphoglycerate synthase [Romeriopsis navalis]MBE9030084.1 glucosyl-3-phosphoglycerate synthase [Romeriopsis navalis LEGE 11480]